MQLHNEQYNPRFNLIFLIQFDFFYPPDLNKELARCILSMMHLKYNNHNLEDFLHLMIHTELRLTSRFANEATKNCW